VHGLKFRRQQVLAGFIVDFYCSEKRLVLELDGKVHDDVLQAEYDAFRDVVLARLDVRVVRIANEDVSREYLLQVLAPSGHTQPSVSPSPERERGLGGEVCAKRTRDEGQDR